ncbi:MAG: hypothetical protein KIT70_09960 [Anaerolineales bacterium]|nr:MAG: hypothetical protein KIT70_09960 [Anaerolineales bacterium]
MTPTTTPNRPWGVTVLIGLVLMFTGLQILRVWAAMRSWDVLTSLPLQVPPAYLLASGALWAALGGGLLYGLALRKAWAPRLARWAGLAYAAFFWADRLLLQAAGPHNSGWMFEAALGLILLGSLFAITASPDAKAYYDERHQE